LPTPLAGVALAVLAVASAGWYFLAPSDAEQQQKIAAEKTTVAAAAPGGQGLFDQAMALEQQGKGGDAVKLYVRAARSGNGKSAKRLGQIYDKGIAGVSRDYAESLKWYNAARVLGEEVPLAREGANSRLKAGR
jgi:TPR repeat protein